jgi:hypothetical protein
MGLMLSKQRRGVTSAAAVLLALALAGLIRMMKAKRPELAKRSPPQRLPSCWDLAPAAAEDADAEPVAVASAEHLACTTPGGCPGISAMRQLCHTGEHLRQCGMSLELAEATTLEAHLSVRYGVRRIADFCRISPRYQ